MKLAFSISWDREKVGITYIWIFLGVEFLAPTALQPMFSIQNYYYLCFVHPKKKKFLSYVTSLLL